MANNTYSWTVTTGSVTTPWTTIADWSTTPAPIVGSFNSVTSDFFIVASNTMDLTGFTNQKVDSLLLDDANATLSFGSTPETFVTGLTLTAGTVDASLEDGGGINIGTGGSAGALVVDGTITAGSSGSSGGGFNIQGVGAGEATMTGTGTIIDTGGSLAIGPNISIASAQSLTFSIADNASNPGVLIFEGDVNSGNVVFQGTNGVMATAFSTLVGNNDTLTNGGTFGASISGLTASSNTTMLNGVDLAFSDGEGGFFGDLGGESITGSVVANGGNSQLDLTDQAGNHYTFNLVGNADVGDTVLTQPDSAVGVGIDVYLMVCYGTGTGILTDRGEVAVETIQEGDTVMTLVDGAHVPQTVKWVGHRDLNLTRLPNGEALAPIRVTRGALGDNLPHRDLVLSPDHCLFIDGALIPVKLLINDMTIVRDLTAKTVTYHHVELERHSVMIAEGVAAESYLDTGNRAFFSNAGLATILRPELNINESLRCWDTDACAPLTIRADLVKPVWQRIADRAATLGHTAPVHVTTRDAAIHLLVDGAVVRPLTAKGKTISFMVPANARSVRLVSRAARQSALTPWLDDPRTLGVAIRSVTLRDQTGEMVLSADHPALRDGWHAAEHAPDGALWRWTAGNAALPIKTMGPCMVEIALSETATYIESARLAA